MLEVDEAISEVLARAKVLAPAVVASGVARLGRVLAADIVASDDSPPFAKSLRDGFAVRSIDCVEMGTELQIVEEIPAGVVPTKPVGAGECSRIFTGAPIPVGADAVVMQEESTTTGSERARIEVSAIAPGRFIFPRGGECRAGDCVLPTGCTINPAAIGVLAALGHAGVPVVPQPRVAILATGDELVAPGEAVGAGHIRNSNGPMLSALAHSAGATVRDMGIVRDEREALETTIAKALELSDVVLLAGGVSAGKFDLVPEVLVKLGVEPIFHQVRMKPGKPIFFGTRGQALVFGLPGNPVSALVGFDLFVRPALKKLGGVANPGPRYATLPLSTPIAESNDRPTYRPALLVPAEVGFAVRPLPWSGAPDLRSAQPAEAWLILPAGDSRFDAGTPMLVVLIENS